MSFLENFKRLIEKCAELSVIMDMITKVTICPKSKELEGLSKAVEPIISNILFLDENLKKMSSIKMDDEKADELARVTIRYFEDLLTEMKKCEKELEDECRETGLCCAALRLLKEAESILSECKSLVEEMRKEYKELKDLCKRCLYYSHTTGLCVKLKKKVTEPFPPCGGKYFKEIKACLQEVA